MVPVEESRGGADYRDAFAGGYAAAAGGRSFQADLPMRLGDLLTHMQQERLSPPSNARSALSWVSSVCSKCQ